MSICIYALALAVRGALLEVSGLAYVMVLSPVRLGVDGFLYDRFAWACTGQICSGLGTSIPWAGLGRGWICSPLGELGWAGFKFTSTSNLANGPGFARLGTGWPALGHPDIDIYIYIYIHLHMYIYSIYICVYLHISMWILTYIYMSIYMRLGACSSGRAAGGTHNMF